MSQKGFATFFGLILVLAVALCAKSIQESEMNYSYAAADYQMEFELQNAAISGIYEAAEKVRKAEEEGDELLPVNDNPTYDNRRNFQVELVKRTIEHADKKYRLKKIYLRVWGERLDDKQKIMRYKRLYPSRDLEPDVEKEKSGYILFSVAESSNERMDGEIYRSAFAYVLSDEDDKKIYFMGPKESD